MRNMLAAAALCLAACEAPEQSGEPAEKVAASGVGMEQYEALKTGMSYADAIAILGSPGEEMSSSEIGGTRTVMYMWAGSTPGANMNAMFQNDKLVQKAQFGL